MVGLEVSHFRILEPLGAGAMGEVFLAEDTRLARPVALKFLPRHLTSDASAKLRFENEARAASALDHPNICAIHEMAETGDGQLLLVMAFCEGKSLKARLDRGALPLAEAIGLAMQVADGLAEAHARGIVHRDIKPANLIVGPTGRVKIVDFGIARLPDSRDATTTGLVLGTPAYMAPEQARGEAPHGDGSGSGPAISRSDSVAGAGRATWPGRRGSDDTLRQARRSDRDRSGRVIAGGRNGRYKPWYFGAE